MELLGAIIPEHLAHDARLLVKLKGSVVPRAMGMAIPSAGLAVLFWHALQEWGIGDPQNGEIYNPWSNFTFVLGAMIVFRTNQAYSRYWEGATLLLKVRGEWYNAASSLIAFCNGSKDRQTRNEVVKYQHHVIRLVSMLYCAGLQQVALVEDSKMEILDTQGLDPEPLAFLMEGGDRCEIVLQWVQRLVVDSMEAGVVNIPAPILSRVFQELSRGIVNVKNVQKIAEIPFPFPYTQVIMMMLFLHTFLTPMQAALTSATYWWAAIVTFVQVLVFWCMNYIAAEIEQPFGEDYNDLPIPELLKDMNRSLRTLLLHQTQNYPRFHMPKGHQAVDLESQSCARASFITGNKDLVPGFSKVTRPNVRRPSGMYPTSESDVALPAQSVSTPKIATALKNLPGLPLRRHFGSRGFFARNPTRDESQLPPPWGYNPSMRSDGQSSAASNAFPARSESSRYMHLKSSLNSASLPRGESSVDSNGSPQAGADRPVSPGGGGANRTSNSGLPWSAGWASCDSNTCSSVTVSKALSAGSGSGEGGDRSQTSAGGRRRRNSGSGLGFKGNQGPVTRLPVVTVPATSDDDDAEQAPISASYGYESGRSQATVPRRLSRTGLGAEESIVWDVESYTFVAGFYDPSRDSATSNAV